MQALAYIAVIEEVEPGAYMITVPDVPEVVSQADDPDEARLNARDALSAALERYLEFGRAFPARTAAPAPAANVTLYDAPVEPHLAARAILVAAMKAEGLSKVALAQRMKRDEKVVRRILSGRSVSLDAMLEALRAVGVNPAFAT